jgi:DNA-binding MarR family transcriptional regulator
MPSNTKVQNTHIRQLLRQLHAAVLEIVAVINRPQPDQFLIREAGIALDRALFPLLVTIQRFGPIGIVDLADRLGRDYTTVSRQVSKLEQLGLSRRQGDPLDRRVSRVTITRKGERMTDLIDAARDRIFRRIFASWDPADIRELVQLMQKFADAVKEPPILSGKSTDPEDRQPRSSRKARL